MVHSLVNGLPLSSMKMDQFKKNDSDPEMQAMQNQVRNGLPLHKAEVPDSAKLFYDLKDEIHIADGVACIGQRLIVPRICEKKCEKEYMNLIWVKRNVKL